MSNLREQRDLLDAIMAVDEERHAAYAEREGDPARWRQAKQEYAEARRFWREVAKFKREVDEAAQTVNVAVSAATGAAIAPEDEEV